MKKQYSRGFTLVEMMIVIIIIALLTGIIITNLSSGRSKSRDVKRISDLGQIQLALELFYDRCKQYPSSLDTSLGCSVSGVTFSSYITTIPSKPEGGSYDYVPSGTPPVDYLLHVTLENTNDLLKDGVSNTDAHRTAAYAYTNCYDVASHPTDYCLGPK